MISHRGLLGLVLVLILPLFWSCQQKAWLVLDPASQYWLETQGDGLGQLAGGFGQAGYRLETLVLDEHRPFAEQLEQVLGAAGPGAAPLVFPPLLNAEAKASQAHWPSSRCLVLPLGETGSAGDSGLLFERLAARSAAAEGRSIAYCHVPSGDSGPAAFQRFQEAFVAAGGDPSRLIEIRMVGLDPDASVHGMAAEIRARSPDTAFIESGVALHKLLPLLENWTGKLVVCNLAAQLGDFSLVAASLEPDWTQISRRLLRGESPRKPEAARPGPPGRLITQGDWLAD